MDWRGFFQLGTGYFEHDFRKLNAFCKSDAAFNKGYEKRRFNLITKKMLLEKVPEDKIPQIIDL